MNNTDKVREITDTELDGLIDALGLYQRRKVVKALLAGNDTQCFTTQQYAEAYHHIAHRADPVHKERWIAWIAKLTPKHMASIGMVEVKPGVWADAEGEFAKVCAS